MIILIEEREEIWFEWIGHEKESKEMKSLYTQNLIAA